MSERGDMVSLKNRALIELTLELEEPLHIGAFQEGVLGRVLMVNLSGKTIPMVPSESMKGVFRQLATRMAKKIFVDGEVGDIVERHNKDRHVDGEEAINNYLKRADEWISKYKIIPGEVIGEYQEAERVELYLSHLCPICSIFGSPYKSARIRLTDFLFTRPVAISTYTGTSINRKSKTVMEERLYKFEYVAPDKASKLKGEIILDNLLPRTNEAKLFTTLLTYLQDIGLWLGGGKSRGYGHVKLSGESKVYLMKFKYPPRDQNDTLYNIRCLLKKDGYIEKLTVNKYIEYLKS